MNSSLEVTRQAGLKRRRFGESKLSIFPPTWVCMLLVFRWLGCALAQNVKTATAPDTNTTQKIEAEPKVSWAFSGSIYTYIVPNSRDYVQPTFTADRGLLRLEARYNYEALDTGSAWVGCNFSGGDKLSWEVSPMLGGVFGNTTGIAPGYKGAVYWWKLELYSEGEYLFDTRDTTESFFYNWSELSVSPLDWFKVGLVTQRTRLYQSDREIQRGVLLGVMVKYFDATVYVLNPDESKPILIFAAACHF
jgi:hypothetical protein